MKQYDQECCATLGLEYQLLQSLSHPHIIRSRDVAPDSSWIALEFLNESQTLWLRVKANGALHAEVALVAMRNLASAVAYLHGRGVFHRDVNPENVLLVGNEGDLRLLDFNAAFAAKEEADGDECLSPGGNPLWLAPEVLSEGFGPAADVWGIGVTLYFAVCSRFESTDRKLFREAAWDAAPAPLKRSVLGCLEPGPASRPTAPALLDALAAAA
jgi:5'-AMP-activated protein kinase catalytic alpha subunit